MVDDPLPLVALFTRAGALGRVKTRLAAAIGERAALAAHDALLDAAIERLRDSDEYELELHVDGDATRLRRHGLSIRAQVAGDLGARMHASIATAVDAGRIGIVVGGDCPLLDRAHVVAAIRALRRDADVAVVPAEDGGYVLVGMRRCSASLFERIDWGTDRVLAQTLARAREQDLRVALQAPLWDVDDEAGYRRWRALGARVKPSDARSLE